MSVQITIVATGSSFVDALAQLNFAPTPVAAAPAETPRPDAKASPTPPAPAPTSGKGKPAKDAPAGTQGSSSAAPAASPASAEQKGDAAEKPTGEGAIDYEVLKAAVFKLAKLDGPAMLAIKDSFGVDHFNKIPPEKRGEALAALNAKITELESA